MESRLNRTTSAKERRGGKPKVSFNGNVLECICSTEGGHSFAISTENGNILEKGKFDERLLFDFSPLQPGFYQLTIFDAIYRDVFSFQVK